METSEELRRRQFDPAREVELKWIEGVQRVYPLATQPLATVD